MKQTAIPSATEIQLRNPTCLANGKILSAKIDNTIEVVSRECADATLTSCTASVPHRILRQIEVY